MISIPSEILDAALQVERWFKENNIKNWQLAGIEVRDYDPEWYEYTPPTPEEVQEERHKLARRYWELREVSHEKARRQWRMDKSWRSISERTAKWAAVKMLAHASPITVLDKFLNYNGGR